MNANWDDFDAKCTTLDDDHCQWCAARLDDPSHDAKKCESEAEEELSELRRLGAKDL